MSRPFVTLEINCAIAHIGNRRTREVEGKAFTISEDLDDVRVAPLFFIKDRRADCAHGNRTVPAHGPNRAHDRLRLNKRQISLYIYEPIGSNLSRHLSQTIRPAGVIL